MLGFCLRLQQSLWTADVASSLLVFDFLANLNPWNQGSEYIKESCFSIRALELKTSW